MFDAKEIKQDLHEENLKRAVEEMHTRDMLEGLCKEVAEIKLGTVKILDKVERTLEKNESRVKWMIVLFFTVILGLVACTIIYLTDSAKKMAVYEDLQSTKANKTSLNIIANWMFENDCNRQRAEQYKKILDIQKEIYRGNDSKINVFKQSGNSGSNK